MARESDIKHECGDYFVLRESRAFTVYKNVGTHAVSDSSYARTPDGLSLAIARCKYMGIGPVSVQRKLEMKTRKSNPAKWTVNNTELETWFERDRAMVELKDKRTGNTIVEWWDEDVAEAIEDGYLSPRDYHGSALEYANMHKLTARKKNPAKRNTKVNRKSQATGKKPTARLVARRKKTVRGPKGYFANPGKKKTRNVYTVQVRDKHERTWTTAGHHANKSDAIRAAKYLHDANPFNTFVRVVKKK